MRKRKLERSQKRQRGQFMTPTALAESIVARIELPSGGRVLEPSCGEGAFLRALLQQSDAPLNLIGIDIDAELLEMTKLAVAASPHAQRCDLYHGDFFQFYLDRLYDNAARDECPFREPFDLIIGNPPFGGSFDPAIEDQLDARLGIREGRKIKKETYSFFIIACAELLKPRGRLVFICSDTLMTIPTMTGLRAYLMETGKVILHQLQEFSDETTYPMLVVEYIRGEPEEVVYRFGEELERKDINATENLSWGIDAQTARLFRGPTLGEYFVASSGMTTGKNEYFVREILANNIIEEPYAFEYFDAPITADYEIERARLNKLSPRKIAQLHECEQRGETQRRIAITERETPVSIPLPHDDYRPYNKASGRILYSPPSHMIYWKDDGDAVLTYKKTGNWYLRGVGGQPYFGREGLTWSLVASRFSACYLPSGYILDSGAPCAFPRKGVDASEIFFVIGWLLTPLANRILKQVINHTRNIQSKDFERMPYPWWVSPEEKRAAIDHVQQLIEAGKAGRQWKLADPEVQRIFSYYDAPDETPETRVLPRLQGNKEAQLSLF